MGFAEVLTIILMIFKLLGIVTYSWVAVFSPMIVVYGLVFIMFFVALLIDLFIGR